MATLVTFRKSPKSKLARITVELNCTMSDKQAKDWIISCYPKACEFEFGTHNNDVKSSGTSLVQCGGSDWDGCPGY